MFRGETGMAALTSTNFFPLDTHRSSHGRTWEPNSRLRGPWGQPSSQLRKASLSSLSYRWIEWTINNSLKPTIMCSILRCFIRAFS